LAFAKLATLRQKQTSFQILKNISVRVKGVCKKNTVILSEVDEVHEVVSISKKNIVMLSVAEASPQSTVIYFKT
jgi:hypothetical protein